MKHHQKIMDQNLSKINPKSTKNQWKINQKSTQNQSNIELKSTKNRPGAKNVAHFVLGASQSTGVHLQRTPVFRIK